jgi:apolipoprotein N-acyltransferase
MSVTTLKSMIDTMTMGNNLHTRVTGLTGWRRWTLAFLLGVLAAGAFAPLHLVFLLIPAMTGLVWLVFSKHSVRAALGVGWWFGLGHFSTGLYWISNALLVQAERFGWMAPFAVFGLAAILAFFPALTTALTRKVARQGNPVGRILIFAAAWTGFEWLRSWLFTGFPWNLIGSAWVFSDAMIQIASIAGVYGLSLISLIAAAMPALLAAGNGWHMQGSSLRAITTTALALVVIWAGGTLRLNDASEEVVPNVRLRLVQPNINQRLKWQQDQRQKNLFEQARMSAASEGQAPTHVIWAETAATYFIAKDAAARAVIARSTPKGGLTITGAPRTSAKKTTEYRIWNSLHAIDENAKIVGTYDKFHLVPFGEYTPFRSTFGFSKITVGTTDFSAGSGLQTLRLKGLPPVSPLICYEVIFPGRVVDKTDRPHWLLNLTNDGWYGVSSGPYQHFATARLRAVEEGLPLVRVANTGISGVIDGYGRTVAKLALDTKGILDSDLPRALPPTLYARLGNWIVIFLLLITAGAGILFKSYHRDS